MSPCVLKVKAHDHCGKRLCPRSVEKIVHKGPALGDDALWDQLEVARFARVGRQFQSDVLDKHGERLAVDVGEYRRDLGPVSGNQQFRSLQSDREGRECLSLEGAAGVYRVFKTGPRKLQVHTIFALSGQRWNRHRIVTVLGDGVSIDTVVIELMDNRQPVRRGHLHRQPGAFNRSSCSVFSDKRGDGRRLPDWDGSEILEAQRVLVSGDHPD